MRSTTNLLIINLAVSDILFVIFCVPFTATDYVLPEWPFGNLWCKFVQYMIVVTCHCRWVRYAHTHTRTHTYTNRALHLQCLHACADVLRSFPGRCTSRYQHVSTHRTQCHTVSNIRVHLFLVLVPFPVPFRTPLALVLCNYLTINSAWLS